LKEDDIGLACTVYETEERNAYRFFMGKPEERRSVGRPSRRWENNTKMDLR
jgi:hypothetical protein